MISRIYLEARRLLRAGRSLAGKARLGSRPLGFGDLVLGDDTLGLGNGVRGDRRGCALRARRGRLTEREAEILEHIAAGMSNKLIARKLDISEGTVKVHVKHLLKKLNLRSRLEAAVWVTSGRNRASS